MLCITRSRKYWSNLKRKLQAEGSEVYEKIVQFKTETACFGFSDTICQREPKRNKKLDNSPIQTGDL
jgi:hypothetical protein